MQEKIKEKLSGSLRKNNISKDSKFEGKIKNSMYYERPHYKTRTKELINNGN